MTNIPLKAVIIEDEKRNAEALMTLITEFCEGVTVVAIAENVKDGYKAIKNNSPDIVFLDVELPGGNGFTLFDYYDSPPDFLVIFTTAYSEYAIQAFDVEAIDYLTKPISIQKLKRAIKRARDLKEKQMLVIDSATQKKAVNESTNTNISINTGNTIIYEKIDQIIRCLGEDNYTTLFFENKAKIVISKTLKFYEDELKNHNFFRCHKSHLVNLSKVKKFIQSERILVMTDDSKVPVSTRKKEMLINKLKGLDVS